MKTATKNATYPPPSLTKPHYVPVAEHLPSTITYHYAVSNTQNLPAPGTVSTFIEYYYDTKDFRLLKAGWWLKMKDYDWSLKIVHGFVKSSGANIIDYHHVTSPEEIKRSLQRLNPPVDDDQLIRYATIPVRQLAWGQFRLDVCQFAEDDYYLLGTKEVPDAPQVRSCDPELEFAYEANAKIIEFIHCYRKDLLEHLVEPPGYVPVNGFGHSKEPPLKDLRATGPKEPPTDSSEYGRWLADLSEDQLKQHQLHWALRTTKDDKHSYEFFEWADEAEIAFGDASPSSHPLLYQLPPVDLEAWAIQPLDDVPCDIRGPGINDSRPYFVFLSLQGSDWHFCLIDTGSPHDLAVSAERFDSLPPPTRWNVSGMLGTLPDSARIRSIPSSNPTIANQPPTEGLIIRSNTVVSLKDRREQNLLDPRRTASAPARASC